MVGKRQKTKNNKMNKKGSATTMAQERLIMKPDILTSPGLYPGSSALNPGVARLRTVVDINEGTNTIFQCSYTDFNNWFGQARQVLIPYAYFRVTDLAAQVIVTGGTTSGRSIAFNVSLNPAGDVGAPAILNDDYSALANTLMRPTIHPPKSIWDSGGRKWYNASDATEYNTQDKVAGSVCVNADGVSAPPLTRAGYLVVSLEIHYHTLL